MRISAQAHVRRWLALAIPALIPVGAFAEPLVLAAGPADGQSTAPIAPRPQNPLSELQSTGNRILVLPFQPVNPGETNIWVGKSVQESLVADLSTLAPDRITTLNQFADSVEAAINLGRQSGARYVIAGGFVTADREVRITGQVLDVQTGQPVTGLKVTGDPGQIFRLEDTLAMQVKGRLFSDQPQTASAPIPQVTVPQPQPDVRVPQPVTETTSVRNEYISDTVSQPAQTYYSSYATTPAPVVYGSDYAAYTSYPSYVYTAPYVYSYPAYSFSYGPYCDFGYGYGGCSSFGWGLGLGLSFSLGFGGCYHDYGRHDYIHRGYDYGRGYNYGNYGRVYSNNGYVSGGIRASGGGVSIGGSVRSPGLLRSGVSSYSRTSVSNSRSYAAPYRAQPFYQHSSFGRTNVSSGFHAGTAYRSFGGGSSHSSGGSISHSSIGGGHSSGGHSGGGGHR